MRQVNSRTIKAYGRAIEGIKVALEADLKSLGHDKRTDRFSKQLHEVAEDILIVAKDLALAEFDQDWGKV
jgi:hypothetical protein